jgi:hypothetical protein
MPCSSSSSSSLSGPPGGCREGGGGGRRGGCREGRGSRKRFVGRGGLLREGSLLWVASSLCRQQQSLLSSFPYLRNDSSKRKRVQDESNCRHSVLISVVGWFVRCLPQAEDSTRSPCRSFLPSFLHSAGLSSPPQPASLNSSRYPPTH